MKTSINLIVAILLCARTFGTTPPAKVPEAFHLKFPKATNVHWGKENKTEWEAEFQIEGAPLSANFSTDGAWVETEQMIKATELPPAVSAIISKEFAGWQITEAVKTETSKNGTIYEADFKKGKLKKAVAYKQDGTKVVE